MTAAPLISSLLLLARSEATTGHEEPVDIAALVADCVTDLRARAQEVRIEISSDLQPAWTDADPGLLERLVANLLDNGIHHNHPGGVLSVTTRGATAACISSSPTAGRRSTPCWPRS